MVNIILVLHKPFKDTDYNAILPSKLQYYTKQISFCFRGAYQKGAYQIVKQADQLITYFRIYKNNNHFDATFLFQFVLL